ncbi:MAG: fibronectin type III domain-containing protein [Lachnospiraceae bacterium]|nr:fibronectin type III domain-containing protein [Lachnospiraceae bacterium]
MKKTVRNILGCLLMLGILMLFPTMKAEAATLTQTGAEKNSVTVSWTAKSDAIQYRVYIGSDYSNTQLYTTVNANTTSATITGLSAGTKYYVRIEYDYYNYSHTGTYSSTAGSKYDVATLPDQVTGVKQERWYYFAKSFNATWDKQTGVDGYQYIVYTNTGKKKTSGTCNSSFSNNASISKISNSVVYTMKVRAFTDINGKRYYGSWSKSAYFFTQPRITKISAKNGKLSVKWGKVAGATGYDVYVSTKKTTGYKKVKSVSKKTSSVSIKKLGKAKISKKKTYYIYIVTKKKVGKTTYTSGRLYYWNSKTDGFGYF